MEALALTKYEGLGNDFLILVDLEQTAPFDGAIARALCNRHHGVGADGLLRVSSPHHRGSFRMDLLNADGSLAETSGNGMRCAVLAAFHHGLINTDEIEVETVAGISAAQMLTQSPTTRADIRVSLDAASVVRWPEYDILSRRAFSVNVGNPHLVLVGDQPDGLDIQTIGPKLEDVVADGQNVELATTDKDRSTITLETWERGAGYTLACGSGSCAAAAAGRFAGLIDDRAVVQNPGGDVVVELSGDLAAPRTVLIGEARRVAAINVSAPDLTAMVEVSGTVT